MKRRANILLLALAAVFIGGAGSPCGHIGDQIKSNIQTTERQMRVSNPAVDIRRVGRRMSAATRRLNASLSKLHKVLFKSLDHPAARELSAEQEYYLGRTVCASVLSERFGNKLVAVRGKGPEATGSDDLHYLQAIAAALLPAAERSHLPELPAERFPAAFRVAVVPGEAPNAFATPGGFVVVSSGLLAIAADEDELAAVLAHELAHVILAHGLSAIDRSEAGFLKKIGRGASTVGENLGVDLSELTRAFDKFTGAITASLTKGYEADYEFAADARAEVILEEAGYDPAALSRVIGRLQTWLAANGKAGFGKTHPAPAERLARLADVPALPSIDEHQKVRELRFAAHTPRLVQEAQKLAAR